VGDTGIEPVTSSVSKKHCPDVPADLPKHSFGRSATGRRCLLMTLQRCSRPFAAPIPWRVLVAGVGSSVIDVAQGWRGSSWCAPTSALRVPPTRTNGVLGERACRPWPQRRGRRCGSVPPHNPSTRRSSRFDVSLDAVAMRVHVSVGPRSHHPRAARRSTCAQSAPAPAYPC
jgi:hypothetical protein